MKITIKEGNLNLHASYYLENFPNFYMYLYNQVGPNTNAEYLYANAEYLYANAEYLYANGAGSLLETGLRDVKGFINIQAKLGENLDSAIRLLNTSSQEWRGDYSVLSPVTHFKYIQEKPSYSGAALQDAIDTVAELSKSAAKSLEGAIQATTQLIIMPHSCMFGHNVEQYKSLTQFLLSKIQQNPNLNSANNPTQFSPDMAILKPTEPLMAELKAIKRYLKVPIFTGLTFLRI
jgi:hypothetical protein